LRGFKQPKPLSGVASESRAWHYVFSVLQGFTCGIFSSDSVVQLTQAFN